MSTDRIALSLPEDYDSARMQAANNYWGTTDVNIINSMIYDKNDSLACYSTINYQPILTTPHPDTPIFEYNQSPTANAGHDQIIFDTITLDGTQSSDPENDALTYEWQIQHTENPDYNYTATGQQVTITGIATGFYDVTLTVTDSAGATDIDTMFFSATGLLGDFDFDGDVDGDDLSNFTGKFGTGVQ